MIGPISCIHAVLLGCVCVIWHSRNFNALYHKPIWQKRLSMVDCGKARISQFDITVSNGMSSSGVNYVITVLVTPAAVVPYKLVYS